MSIVTFVVPGIAVGKGRPKFARRGNFVAAYTPEKTASYENLVKLHAGIAMDGSNPFIEAVRCVIDVSVIPSASFSKKKRLEALSGVLHPTSKPDIDNVTKGIFDAMNGIVWLDDKQVVEMVVRKRYAEIAQTVVTVEQIES